MLAVWILNWINVLQQEFHGQDSTNHIFLIYQSWGTGWNRENSKNYSIERMWSCVTNTWVSVLLTELSPRYRHKLVCQVWIVSDYIVIFFLQVWSVTDYIVINFTGVNCNWFHCYNFTGVNCNWFHCYNCTGVNSNCTGVNSNWFHCYNFTGVNCNWFHCY